MKIVKDTTVTRSVLHNKRMAPKGCVFFVAKTKIMGREYSLAVCVNTKDSTPEMEDKLKEDLLRQLHEKLQEKFNFL